MKVMKLHNIKARVNGKLHDVIDISHKIYYDECGNKKGESTVTVFTKDGFLACYNSDAVTLVNME